MSDNLVEIYPSLTRGDKELLLDALSTSPKYRHIHLGSLPFVSLSAFRFTPLAGCTCNWCRAREVLVNVGAIR